MTMNSLFIIIPGEPVAKGRPRIGTNRHTGRAIAFTPARTVRAEATIAHFAAQAMAGRDLLTGPLMVIITAYRSKGMPGSATAKEGTKARTCYDAAEAGTLKPITKPDADNYLKTVCDALNGVVYHDDAQITDITIRKRYSSQPRLEIHIQEQG